MTITLTEHKQEKIFKLMNDNNELNAIRFYTIEEMIQAHELLTAALAKKKALDYIGTAQALAYAEAEGYTIPITTIINACARRTIENARKKSSRWMFPRENFLEWFGEWKAKQDGKAND